MIYILTADGQSYRLTGSWELTEATIKFQDRAKAVEFLRRFLKVPSAMRSLRSALAEDRSMTGNTSGKMTDQKVIEAVVTLLLQGRFNITPVDSLALRPGLGSGTFGSFRLSTFPIEPISKKGQIEIRKFEKKFSSAYELTARDLAMGRTSKQLDETKLLPMVSDLMLNLPFSDSDLGTSLGGFMGLSNRQMGLSPKELGSEFGEEVGDKAKDMMDSLRKDKPLLFWPGAIAAGLGAGALTYTQGTGLLEQVGIDPKFSTDFLKGKVSLEAEGGFGPKLSDPTATVSSKQWLTDNLSLWQSASASGPELSKMRLDKYSLGMDYNVPLKNPDNSLKMGASYLRDMESDSSVISGYLKGKTATSTYGLESKYDLNSSDYSVTGYAGKQLGWGSSFEGYASHQDWGGTRSSNVGLRLVKRF